MGVKNIVSVSVLGLGFGMGLYACAESPSGGGGGGDDHYSDRVDASDFVADDGAVLGESTMIDDLEDGDGAINELLGRIGSWYSFNDGTAGGTQNPAASAESVAAAGGARDSAFAAHFSGKGWKEWGAGIGLDINAPGPATPTDPDLKNPYDASQYTGVAFEAKGNVPIRFAVAEVATNPVVDGGTCTPSEVEGMMCEDTHGKTITLTSGWTTFEIPFADLRQEGFGKPATFDAKTITGFQFSVAQNLEFDYYIDNVRFY